jgi:hypothetical protein
MPTRFWVNRIGPGESSLMAMHRIRRIGDNTRIPMPLNRTSMVLFIGV